MAGGGCVAPTPCRETCSDSTAAYHYPSSGSYWCLDPDTFSYCGGTCACVAEAASPPAPPPPSPPPGGGGESSDGDQTYGDGGGGGFRELHESDRAFYCAPTVASLTEEAEGREQCQAKCPTCGYVLVAPGANPVGDGLIDLSAASSCVCLVISASFDADPTNGWPAAVELTAHDDCLFDLSGAATSLNRVWGNAGHDYLVDGPSHSMYWSGAHGDDTMIAGDGDDAYWYGYTGNDKLCAPQFLSPFGALPSLAHPQRSPSPCAAHRWRPGQRRCVHRRRWHRHHLRRRLRWIPAS